jgi:hypothetical protein
MGFTSFCKALGSRLILNRQNAGCDGRANAGFVAGVSKAQKRLRFKGKLGQGFAGTGVYFAFEKLNIGAAVLASGWVSG